MTVASGDAHPWPIYNARFRVVFPVFDADGDLVTAMSTPDSEVSQDQGTFADATNEATEIATSSGMYYLDLIATELDCKCAAVIVKSATAGMKTTPLILYPRRFPVLRTGTAQAGAATTITLDSSASAKDDFYNGCYVNITNNSPANALGQARRITDYVGSTKVATVEAAWGTNPSSASTFEVLLTDDLGGDNKLWQGTATVDSTNVGVPNVNVAQWLGTAAATPTVAGVPEVDVTHWLGTAAATPTVAGVPEVDVTHWIGTAAATPTVAGVPEVDTTHFGGTAGTFASGRPEVNTSHAAGTAWNSGAIGAATLATDTIGSAELAADAVTEIRSLASGTSDSGTTTTMVDAARTEADTDYWKGQYIVFTSGNIAGQARLITAFDAATDTVTFTPATTQAVAAQTYEIWPGGGVDILQMLGVSQSITDLKDFADDGYDPATNKVQGVVLTDTVTTYTGNTPQTGDSFPLVSTEVAEIYAAVITNAAGVDIAADIIALQADLPQRITKNVAFAAFAFYMVSSTDHVTAKTGATVTAERSIDGAAFAACVNAVAEIANGWYKIDLAASDVNGNSIALKFTATGADQQGCTIITAPT